MNRRKFNFIYSLFPNIIAMSVTNLYYDYPSSLWDTYFPLNKHMDVTISSDMYLRENFMYGQHERKCEGFICPLETFFYGFWGDFDLWSTPRFKFIKSVVSSVHSLSDYNYLRIYSIGSLLGCNYSRICFLWLVSWLMIVDRSLWKQMRSFYHHTPCWKVDRDWDMKSSDSFTFQNAFKECLLILLKDNLLQRVKYQDSHCYCIMFHSVLCSNLQDSNLWAY